tara:strand:- start:86 stop:517 length:432 start_codon:yes stop_codon:yes gene_type:complete
VKYEYRNITSTDPHIVIHREDSGVFTIHKCEIANVDSSAAVVDVYLEHISLSKTIKLHGDLNSGNKASNDDYVNKEDQKIYHKVKGVTLPVGTTLSLFTDHPCRHGSRFNFVVKATQKVDVIVDYEHNKTTTNNNRRRSSNQY